MAFVDLVTLILVVGGGCGLIGFAIGGIMGKEVGRQSERLLQMTREKS